MKFKKVLIGILLIVVAIYGTNYVMKNILFPFKHKEVIQKYSEEYGLDPYYVLSIIKTESKFNPNARSHKDAVGLMQVTEDTGKWIAEEMGLTDYTPEKLYDEEYNIKMGCWYLDNLRTEFGSLDLVTAAYNGGSGNVKHWLGDKQYSEDGKKLDYIPFKETKKYVDRVNAYYGIYKFLYE